MGVVGRAWAMQRGCPGTGRSWSKNQLNLFHMDAESNDSGCAQEVEVTIFLEGIFGWRGWEVGSATACRK
jgi:hypothetical protein